jgi:peptidoglycan/LPS O-acetylase OafA/YrhL
MNGWNPGRENIIVPGGWSISAEATFALLFVTIVPWTRSASRALFFSLITLLTALSAMLFLQLYVGDPANGSTWDNTLEYAAWRHLSTFLFGIGCWHVWKRNANSSARKKSWFRVALTVLAFLGFSLLSFELVPRSSRALIAGSASCLILFAWADVVQTHILHRALRTLGQLSFGIYLFHFVTLGVSQVFVLGLLPIETPSLWLFLANFALALALTLPLAWLSWNLIERPLQDYVRHKISGWSPRTVESASQQPKRS